MPRRQTLDQRRAEPEDSPDLTHEQELEIMELQELIDKLKQRWVAYLFEFELAPSHSEDEARIEAKMDELAICIPELEAALKRARGGE